MKKEKGKGTIVQVAIWYVFILGIFAGIANWLPQIRGDAPEAAVAVDLSSITPEKLAEMGKMIVFGTVNPSFGGGGVPIGKGQCPLCHMFFQEQKADRCPVLIGEEGRSNNRVKEERYKAFASRLANGEPNSGIKPHATKGGEYLVESEYCPNCYVVEGFGIKGTNDQESPMPRINKPPIGLTDTEIVAVVSFLQTKDDGDFTKWTAKDSWESYWGKPLKADAAPKEGEAKAVAAGPPVALESDTPEQIVQKMTCFACHKIPGISIAKTGMIGPLLIEKTNAPNRIKSPEYQKAVKEGKAHAKTPREYVMESIMNPAAFIVPGFADDMIKDFRHKFTVAGLDKLVDYLLEQDAPAAIKEGLDRLPNEKEGPLKKVDLSSPEEKPVVDASRSTADGKHAAISGKDAGGKF